MHDFPALNENLEPMLALMIRDRRLRRVSNANMHLRAAVLRRTARVLVPAELALDGGRKKSRRGFRGLASTDKGMMETGMAHFGNLRMTATITSRIAPPVSPPAWRLS